jgi:hypothetical protein
MGFDPFDCRTTGSRFGGGRLPSAIQYVGKAAGVPSTWCSTMRVFWEKYPSHGNLGQGRRAKEMLAPVVTAVKALQPEYIRLDHIYDAFKVGAHGWKVDSTTDRP